jgi:hypothetical protein
MTLHLELPEANSPAHLLRFPIFSSDLIFVVRDFDFS